jgi:multidrug resistance efflux pump
MLLVFMIPMNFGAPSGPVVVMKNMVQISPSVAGPVIDVPVSSNTALQKGDVLFRIDSAPFQAAVDSLGARLTLAELRLQQASELAADQAGSVYEVQQYDAEVRGLQADLKAARWNLNQTTVKAPADGWVPDVALLPGVRLAAGQAAIAFIDESETFLVVQMQQINTRHIEPGDAAEVIFKVFPGQIFSATVVRVFKANSSGQLAPGGTIVAVDQFDAAPFMVHLSLDDPDVFVPAGSVGTAAIYTDQFTGLSHVIRKILLHQQNWKNYIQI